MAFIAGFLVGAGMMLLVFLFIMICMRSAQISRQEEAYERSEAGEADADAAAGLGFLLVIIFIVLGLWQLSGW